MSRKLLSAKELADELSRSERYVRQMRREGFEMDGMRATVDEARRWLKGKGDKLRWRRKR